MATPTPLVVGVFQREVDARQAVTALYHAGFIKDQLGLAFLGRKAVPHNLAGELVRLGLPADQADYYNSEFQAGRFILSVRPHEREREAVRILREMGAYNYAQREALAPALTDTNTQSDMGDENVSTLEANETRSVPLRAEVLHAEKQRVQSGEVRFHKEIVTEEQSIDVTVKHEEVHILHHPLEKGRIADTPIGADETLRIPVSEERVHVTKVPYVTEEVSLGKRAVEETRQITGTVRREVPHLEKEGEPHLHVNQHSEHVE